MNSSHSTADISSLDHLTGGAFSATHSGDRANALRDWLNREPALEQIQEVYREMAARDKGAAKVLKGRLDELKRQRGQDALLGQWADRAEQLLQGARLNIADALAWQRDAAKAGAPLSREPLATLKNRLSEMVRRVEDLQHQVMVQREAAVLLAQRIEVLSTKPLQEARGSCQALQADVQSWIAQGQSLTDDSAWPSVDLKFPPQLEASRTQLQAVWSGFEAALHLADSALQHTDAALPPVPVWAEEIRALRTETPSEPTGAAARAVKPRMDAAERQALREQATQAVVQELEALEKEVADGHGKASAGAASALRNVLKTHGRHLDPALDARVHQALTSAGELEGWQRWRADQLRQELLVKAQALLGPDKNPVLGGRKMQEALRELREAWKQTDQGGLPNHALWKKFDAACTEAYKTVQAWLDQLKQENAAQKTQRLQLIEEVKAWTAAQLESSDWRAQSREIHRFSERWRSAGHLGEKAYAELQPQWKAAIHAAAIRLEAAQKQSIGHRQAMIEEAKGLAAAAPLRVDAVKALQLRWQQEAQAVPLDRRTEQKLWESFRQPIDEAFQRKGARPNASVELSPRDRVVLEASRALDEANASGDAGRIRTAMAALDAALAARALAAVPETPSVGAGSASAQPATEHAETAIQNPHTPETDEPVASAPAARPSRPLVAVRGDDRPGQKRTELATGRPPGRREPRSGDRGTDRSGRHDRREGWREERHEDRGPRLGDAAFRAQREARERAELALRKLAAQAHGETLTRLLEAWKDRQPNALPSLQDLGKAVSGAARQHWIQALSEAPAATAGEALLRLEMAAQIPTPAEHLNERRNLQLQLLTRRHEAGPSETWAQDVARVLTAPHDENSARRLLNALRPLMRR